MRHFPAHFAAVRAEVFGFNRVYVSCHNTDFHEQEGQKALRDTELQDRRLWDDDEAVVG